MSARRVVLATLALSVGLLSSLSTGRSAPSPDVGPTRPFNPDAGNLFANPVARNIQFSDALGERESLVDRGDRQNLLIVPVAAKSDAPVPPSAAPTLTLSLELRAELSASLSIAHGYGLSKLEWAIRSTLGTSGPELRELVVGTRRWWARNGAFLTASVNINPPDAKHLFYLCSEEAPSRFAGLRSHDDCLVLQSLLRSEPEKPFPWVTLLLLCMGGAAFAMSRRG